MDPDQIDRLRHPGFTLARRGYDRREVDNLLGSLVDWLESDAAGEIGDLAVRRKIELDPTRPRYLLTETGAGYRFVDAKS